MSHGSYDDRGDTPTQPTIAARGDVIGRLKLHDEELQRLRGRHDDLDGRLDALLKGFGTLTSTVNSALDQLKRGWTPDRVHTVVAAAVIVAIAAVAGGGALVWMAMHPGGG